MRKTLVVVALLALAACKKEQSNNLPDGLYADVETNKGHIILALEMEKAPITVASFVSLAEGNNDFVAPQYKGKPFYDNLKWHRVIKDFMIQGGDPRGDGTGDAGYEFIDEFRPKLQFDKGGVLAMANNGPATNSCQFFITHVPTPWLDGRHTIFGHVVGTGMDVVNQINQGDDIVSVRIIRNGQSAKKFNAVKVFDDYYRDEAAREKKHAEIEAQNRRAYDLKYKTVKDQKVAYFESIRKTAKTTRSGLQYAITKKSAGKKPEPGQTIFINYSGFLEDGTWFDGSDENVARQFGKLDVHRSEAGQYTPITFQAGRKDGMIPGFIEGIDQLSVGDKAVIFIPPNLAYGAQGAQGVIPPNATIIFEIELLDRMASNK